jgi:hypothetical protein
MLRRYEGIPRPDVSMSQLQASCMQHACARSHICYSDLLTKCLHTTQHNNTTQASCSCPVADLRPGLPGLQPRSRPKNQRNGPSAPAARPREQPPIAGLSSSLYPRPPAASRPCLDARSTAATRSVARPEVGLLEQRRLPRPEHRHDHAAVQPPLPPAANSWSSGLYTRAEKKVCLAISLFLRWSDEPDSQ